jgi:hypothetical protein
MPERIASKKPEEIIPIREGALTAYERSKASETFWSFFHEKVLSPKEFLDELSEILKDPKAKTKREEQRQSIAKDVNVLLKDKELGKIFLDTAKIHIRVDKPDISSLLHKLQETEAYSDLAAKFRQEDHAELRDAIAHRLRYRIMESRVHSSLEDTIDIRRANRIMDDFGVAKEENVPVEKRTGILRKETVMERHELTVYKRLEKFKKGEF